MKACEPVKPTPSQPSTPKTDNAPSVSIFRNFFCYIVHAFFPFRKVTPNMEPTPSGSVESATKKTTKCRVPVFIRRMKATSDGAKQVEKNDSQTENLGEALIASSKHKVNVEKLPTVKLVEKTDSGTSSKQKTKPQKPVETLRKTPVKTSAKVDAIPPIVSLVNATRESADSNISPKHSSTLSVSKSLSCHLLVAPKPSKIQRNVVRKRTSENSVQVAPPNPKLSQLSRAIQVGSGDVVFKTYTTQLEVVPPSRGDADKPSPIPSRSSLTKRPLPRKRTFSNLNPPLLRNKSVVAATKKPPEPLKTEAVKTLTLPSSLTPPPKLTTTNSSQTIESWPVLQKRLGLFERTKRKLSRERKKPLTSTYVQAVEAPVKRANVKCLVYVEQGSKGTLARIAPSGLERIESCVNTEPSDNSSGIQCDIALRRSRTPRRTASTRKLRKIAVQNKTSEDVKPQTDEGKLLVASAKQTADKSEIMDVVHAGKHKKVRSLKKWETDANEVVKDVSDGGKKDLVTVLSKRRMDPMVSNSESVCPDHHCSDLKVITTTDDDDPLHCLNEFISLEHMLHRLQDEIHGLDNSIRQISNNYQFPSVLTSVAPTASFNTTMKSVAGLVRSYQNELDLTANQQFGSAYRRHSFNEYH